jgi:hypothetical protein
MESLIIQSTTNTPAVRFNPQNGKFLISGVSLPENVLEFYEPVMHWIEEYFEKPNHETIFEFKFNYLNTASSKIVSNILQILDQEYTKGINVSILWYFDFEDAEIKELGQDLSEMMDIPMEFLASD